MGVFWPAGAASRARTERFTVVPPGIPYRPDGVHVVAGDRDGEIVAVEIGRNIVLRDCP